MKKSGLKVLMAVVTAATMAGCGKPSIPTDACRVDKAAVLTPAYSDSLTLPVNIAPLNFCVEGGRETVVCITAPNGQQLVTDGLETDFPVDDWHRLLAAAQGDWLTVDIYQRNDTWQQLRSLHWYVAPDSIDPYLVYRLIEPSYVAYEKLTIEQRSLESFDTQVLYDNMAQSQGENGQCVNCHSFQQWNTTGRWQLHFRQNFGGTLVAQGDRLERIAIQSEQQGDGGVYVRGGV